MKKLDWIDIFRNCDDDELWDITKKSIKEIQHRLLLRKEEIKMNAKYAELINFTDDFINTDSYSLTEKIKILKDLISYFQEKQKYKRCAKIQKLIAELL